MGDSNEQNRINYFSNLITACSRIFKNRCRQGFNYQYCAVLIFLLAMFPLIVAILSIDTVVANSH
jgi:uncharacterized BrkB/YihY/UPF0761 family membrane protein